MDREGDDAHQHGFHHEGDEIAFHPHHHELIADPPDLKAPLWGWMALTAFGALVICGYVATAVAPRWVLTNPEGLLALNSRIRHLLLAAGNEIPFPSYMLIAGFRLALAFVVCHLIGRAFGNRVLELFGKYLGVPADSIRAMLDGVDRYEWIIIPIFTGSNLVAAITGIKGTRPLRLGVLLTVGIVGRLLLYWWIAQIFDDELDTVLDWLARYQTPALIVSIVAVVVVVLFNLRRGKDFRL